ncbi:MAG TPA: flavodoxin, partial [Lachnospiraceae bacterium]|nr:flavodoxin [Lachnospiraceae bacterium]
MSKLVVYFSFSGVTAKKAKKLAKKNSADIFELKAKIPYTKADVNWRDKKSRNV